MGMRSTLEEYSQASKECTVIEKWNTKLAQSWSSTPQMANYSKCRESMIFFFFFLVYLEEEESKQDGQWWNHLI